MTEPTTTTTDSTPPQTTTEYTTPQTMTGSTTTQITTESTTQQTMTETITPQSKLVITIAIFASVVGVLIVINVITLKHRNRNYDIEEDKPQDEYATSDLPSCDKDFDNAAYVPSESKRPDERMDNDIV
jgi:hypothetical protein